MICVNSYIQNNMKWNKFPLSYLLPRKVRLADDILSKSIKWLFCGKVNNNLSENTVPSMNSWRENTYAVLVFLSAW